MSEKQLVVVTTEFKGVFMGYVADDSDLPTSLKLKDCRCMMSWPSTVGGFLGLADVGPIDGTEMTKKVSEINIYKVTSMAKCNEEATKVYENWTDKKAD